MTIAIIFVLQKDNISQIVCPISMADSLHNGIQFLSLPAWKFDLLWIHITFITLAVTIPSFKTNFWISQIPRSVDFVLLETFLNISGLACFL